MLHPSTKKLIDRLSEMTLQRKIDWVQGETPETLAYDTEGYRVLLEGDPASLVLCDALGGELDRASLEELTATKHIDGGTYETLMESMRAEASRIARGAEDAISSVLGSLDLDGDGIPDVPAPMELEAAPDGPISETMDDIEDHADELSAASDMDVDVPADMDGSLPDSLETADDRQEVPLDNVFPEDEFADIPTPAETPVPDIIPEAGEALAADVSEAVSVDGFEDASDVGQAVADLAEQVNNTQTQTQSEDANPLKGSDAASVIGASSFLTAFNGFPNGNAGGMIVQETVDTTAAQEPQQEPAPAPATGTETEPLNTDAGLDNLQAEQGLQAETLGNFEDSLPGVPKPGETVFLSELAEDAPEFEDIQMETANPAPVQTDQQAVDVSPPSIETPQEPAGGSEIDAEPAPEAPAVPQDGGEVPFPMADDERELEPVEAAATSDQMDSETIPDDGVSNEPADEPAIEAEQEAEAPVAEVEIDLIEDAPPAPTEAPAEGEAEPDEQPKTPKRFNPWI